MAITKKQEKKNIFETKDGIVNYPAGDFLIRVKNAALARRKEVVVQRTKLVEAIAKALSKQGYLDEVKKQEDKIIVSLKYRRKEPVLLGMKLISRPGLRVYTGVDDLEKRRKPSTLLISSPKGIISGKEAIKARLGGEAIVEVW